MAFNFRNPLGRIATKPRVRVGTKVKDIDKGFKLLMNNLRVLDGQVVKIGILERNAKDKYPNGATLGEVAVRNEFGIGPPERRFLRSTFDQKNKQWAKEIAKYMSQQSVRSTFDRRVTIFIGKVIRNDVAQTVLLKKSPPNARFTVLRKGFNDPLIHTFKLHNSLNFEVKKGI